MDVSIAAYPLQWPISWPRTDFYSRRYGKFGTKRSQGWGKDSVTVAGGTQRVLAELQRMGVQREDVVISTNVRLRIDGLPRSGEKEPDDPGAAVYWEECDGSRRVMAIDQYLHVADNLAAIAATLDAMRAIERHGGAEILDRAFTGFAALSAPAARDWQAVLELQALLRPTEADVRAAFRRLANIHHPDKPGGSHDKMAEINKAYAEALEACNG